MELSVWLPVILVGAAVLGFSIGWVVTNKMAAARVASAKENSRKLLDDATKEADTLKREKLLEVKDEWYQKKKEFDTDVQSKRNKLSAQERRLTFGRRTSTARWNCSAEKNGSRWV